MDTEKTTNTTAESLNSTPPTEPTEDEKDFYNGIIYSLFEEAVKELDKQTEAERAEEQKVLARFAELEGVKEKSPYTMLFAGFRYGVAKGLDLAARMENRA